MFHFMPQSDFPRLLKLLTCYISAIIHDYDHRGLTNDFLIKTSDPLAIVHNDVSPMENHHLAAAFMLMNEEQYCFLPANKKVCCLDHVYLYP